MESRKLAFLAVLLLVTASTVQAGQITGRVFYKDGSNGSNLRVSGETSDGFTSVYTDGKGRFTLRWSTNKTLLRVYVKGNVRARNVRNGSNITIRLP